MRLAIRGIDAQIAHGQTLRKETGQRCTVKRYGSEEAAMGDCWRHERITLKPLNPDLEPIVIAGPDHGEPQVIAEFLEVLTHEAPTEGG